MVEAHGEAKQLTSWAKKQRKKKRNRSPTVPLSSIPVVFTRPLLTRATLGTKSLTHEPLGDTHPKHSYTCWFQSGPIDTESKWFVGETFEMYIFWWFFKFLFKYILDHLDNYLSDPVPPWNFRVHFCSCINQHISPCDLPQPQYFTFNINLGSWKPGFAGNQVQKALLHMATPMVVQVHSTGVLGRPTWMEPS